MPIPFHPDVEAETQRRLTVQLFGNAPFTWGIHLANATLLAGVNVSQATPPWLAWAWWALIAVAATVRYALARRFALSPEAESPLGWQRRYVRATAFLSAAWGAGAILFVWNGSEGMRLFTGLVLAGMIAGVMPLLVSVPAALRTFVGLAGLPMAAAVLLRAHSTVQWAFGFTSLIFMAYILSGAKRLHRMLEVSIRLGLEQGRLAEGLERAHASTAQALAERKSLEEAMRRERDFAESLIDTAQAIVIVLDTEGRILRFNHFMEELSGYTLPEILNADWFSVFPPEPERREARARFLTAIAAGQSTANTSEILARDGRRILVEWHDKALMDGDGAIIGLLALGQDVTQRKAMEEELQRLATTDPLTGVANRRRLLQEMDMELARHKRFHKPATFLMLDIDHFKQVNDTHGHAIGDLVIRHLAELSRLRLRRLDLFGRLGGEEFGILLPGTDASGAMAFAEAFRRQVEGTPTQTGAGPIPLTVSIGVTAFGPGDTEADSILARADAALYQAKEGGRNRVELG